MTRPKEEPWKTFLNWSVIIMFIAMPVLVMVIQLYALSHPAWLSSQLPQTEFKYLYEFQRALAILVFGLAGLRTWEVVKNGKHPNQQRKEEP
jgi:hypothetical protein